MNKKVQHRSTQGRRMVVGAAVMFALVSALFGAAAFASGSTAGEGVDGAEAAEQDVAPWAYDVPDTPSGMTGVSGSEGQVVGFVRNTDLAAIREHGESPLGIEVDGTELLGLRVWGEDGALVGYLLSGNAGFVSVQEVGDAETLEDTADTWQEERTEAEEPPPADLVDELPEN